MNSRLPTDDEINYFWAEPSRELILANKVIISLHRSLKDTSYAFRVDEYYQSIINHSMTFLSSSGGSKIPSYTKTIELYYTIPIFIKGTSTAIKIDTPEIRAIDTAYIKDIAMRAQEDIKHGHYDSALTKARTLLEEVFCHAIESKSKVPDRKGSIKSLYKQVRSLYHMDPNEMMDTRIKGLLSGLTAIISSIAEMRNKESDAHGVGSARINISEHHTRLFLNSAMLVADFILSVEKNQIQHLR